MFLLIIFTVPTLNAIMVLKPSLLAKKWFYNVNIVTFTLHFVLSATIVYLSFMNDLLVNYLLTSTLDITIVTLLRSEQDKITVNGINEDFEIEDGVEEDQNNSKY